MSAAGGDELQQPGDQPTAPDAVILLTRLGKCLVHCAAASQTVESVLHVGPLCQLIATLMDCSGAPSSAFVQLYGRGVVLVEGYSVIVAVLCDAKRGCPSARLLASQVLNAFGKLFHASVDELAAEQSRQLEAGLNSYTFHSATRAADEAACTAPAFVEFARRYVQPLLLRPPLETVWLASLRAPGCALSAFLVNPCPLHGQETVLLASGPARKDALALSAGPHVPAVWEAVLEDAQAVVQARAAAVGRASAGPRLAVRAFPALPARGGGGDGAGAAECLHVAVRGVRLVPGGGCLVLFYAAALPPSEPAEAPGQGGPPAASGVSLVESAAPEEVRSALHGAARLVAASFPTAAADIHLSSPRGSPPGSSSPSSPRPPGQSSPHASPHSSRGDEGGSGARAPLLPPLATPVRASALALLQGSQAASPPRTAAQPETPMPAPSDPPRSRLLSPLQLDITTPRAPLQGEGASQAPSGGQGFGPSLAATAESPEAERPTDEHATEAALAGSAGRAGDRGDERADPAPRSGRRARLPRPAAALLRKLSAWRDASRMLSTGTPSPSHARRSSPRQVQQQAPRDGCA